MAAKTTEARIATINAKIEKKQAEIVALEAQKHKLEHPITLKSVMAKAKNSGMTLEEIAETLGLEV